jgi:hypothetical protein
MTDQYYVYATAAIIVALVLSQVFRRSFDPFEPVWLFLTGYAHIYVLQAISCRDYALRVRGIDLVSQANLRALWALAWFLLVYYSGIGRRIAARLPRPPQTWSTSVVAVSAPPMVVWGLICSGMILSRFEEPVSAEGSLLRQFPLMMLIAAIALVVTGRQPSRPAPALTATGLALAALYSLIWMYNGKRSHALFGVLTAVCAFYTPRCRRPGLPMLAATAVAGVLVVTLAIGWRGNRKYEQSVAGFAAFVGDFDPSSMLVNLSFRGGDGDLAEPESRETEEYGGFLLMMDTVPDKSPYDYGAPYLRLVSTYIPRIVWPDKPLFGREQWVGAWIAGSEFHRDANFTGPAIGILGACQLNGGATATLIVLAVVALMLRTAYDYYRYHALAPWAQFWWAMTYYNAWMLTANDDPFVWFYYNYGNTTVPPLAVFWICNTLADRGALSSG